jgi:hypothetical protein
VNTKLHERGNDCRTVLTRRRVVCVHFVSRRKIGTYNHHRGFRTAFAASDNTISWISALLFPLLFLAGV